MCNDLSNHAFLYLWTWIQAELDKRRIMTKKNSTIFNRHQVFSFHIASSISTGSILQEFKYQAKNFYNLNIKILSEKA